MARHKSTLTLRQRILRRIYRKLGSLHDEAVRVEIECLKRQLGSIGPGVHIYGPIRITSPDRWHLGSNVHINKNSIIRAEGNVTIGDNTHIAQNLCLYSANHRFREASNIPYDEKLELRPVHIGRNVWIGINVVIAPGATIGDGAIVGMGTSVFGDVPARAIIGSSKWRQIGARDEEEYERLESAGRYGGPNGYPYKAAMAKSNANRE